MAFSLGALAQNPQMLGAPVQQNWSSIGTQVPQMLGAPVQQNWSSIGTQAPRLLDRLAQANRTEPDRHRVKADRRTKRRPTSTPAQAAANPFPWASLGGGPSLAQFLTMPGVRDAIPRGLLQGLL